MRNPERLWNLSGIQLFFILVLLAVAAGFVGATSFALAAGLDLSSEREGKLAASGIIFGFLTLALLILLAQVIRSAVVLVSQSESRPGTPVAVTLIICGTLCLVAALGVAIWRTAGSAEFRLNPGGRGGVTVVSGGSLTMSILAIGVFLAGFAMVALGIWSGVGQSRMGRIPPDDERLATRSAPPGPVAAGDEHLVAVQRAE